MRSPAASLTLMALVAACDLTTAPPAPAPTGDLRIATLTDGLDAPPMYVVSLDGEPLRNFAPTDSAVLKEIVAGSHSVLLSQVGANCTVQGSNPRVVEVTDGALTPVLFPVTCVATTGVIEIATVTTGLDAPFSYPITVDNAQQFTAANSTVALSGFPGGDHVVALGNVPPNCSVTSGATRTANVKVGGATRDTARIAFSTSCTTVTGIIEVAFSATGVDIGDAFSIALDGAASRSLSPGTTTRFSVRVGDHAVKLNVVAGNCLAAGGSTNQVVVSASAVVRDTARTSFQVTCTPSDLIALEREGSVYVIRTDGSNPVMLAPGGEPAWSPDRDRIVFSHFDCYYYCYDLGLIIADFRSGTKVLTRLTSFADYGPSWSADGTVIGFVRGGKPFFINPDGSGQTGIALPAGTIAISRVSWSPDATRVAFSCGSLNQDFSDICVVNRNGSGFAQLTFEAHYNTQPAWSPDGSVIAFVRTDYRTRAEAAPKPYVALMNPDGSGVTRVTDGEQPAWSKDGKTIVFRSLAAAGLATIKPDGTGLTQITTNSYDYAPAWRP